MARIQEEILDAFYATLPRRRTQFFISTCQVLLQKKDIFPLQADTSHMGTRSTSSKGPGQFMAFVRQQIERGGEQLWKLEDFRDLPFMAVAQALSRLTRQGRLERLSTQSATDC